MKALGFRVEPTGVNWALVEGSNENPILVAADRMALPATYDEPSSLTWIRSQVQQLIHHYSPQLAAVRYAEPVARPSQSTNKRCRIEGVIAEVAASSGLQVVTGALATISKNLGTKGAKKYLETGDLRGLDWSKHPANRREAILVGVSALS